MKNGFYLKPVYKIQYNDIKCQSYFSITDILSEFSFVIIISFYFTYIDYIV